MNFSFDDVIDLGTNIKVVGVGGAGGNAINRMIQSGMGGVEFIAMNTDNQILQYNKATFKLQLGDKLTKGRGAGGDPEKGKRAAEESRDEIVAALRGTDMVFITAGMGGGTGTGAAPIVAEIAKDMGALTVAIVSKPFEWEGKRKMQTAEIGIANLREHVDSIVVIPNSRLKLISDVSITLANAFEMADNVLKQGVQSVSDLINVSGLINLDFADVSAVMRDAGYAHMGVGRAGGREKAEVAANMAISSPLLETAINGAKGVIINFTTSSDTELNDIELAATMMTKAAHEDANIIWGAAFDDSLQDEMIITVIATGFDTLGLASTPSQPRKPEFFSNSESVAREEPQRPVLTTDEIDLEEVLKILDSRPQDNIF